MDQTAFGLKIKRLFGFYNSSYALPNVRVHKRSLNTIYSERIINTGFKVIQKETFPNREPGISLFLKQSDI